LFNSKTTKIPRGKLVNVTNLPPFTRIHCDFSFYGTTSLCGYKTAFDITCASTSYTLGFPSKSKGPPIRVVIIPSGKSENILRSFPKGILKIKFQKLNYVVLKRRI
jgi:hypothetical protein